MIIQHKFVEFMPGILEEGVLYISMEYRTAIHKCVCGCGNQVVTPFSPTDWKLTFDGKTVSLYPSIGNWNFDCKSHYWIQKSVIEHAKSWTKEQILSGREADTQTKADFYTSPVDEAIPVIEPDKISFWKRVLKMVGL